MKDILINIFWTTIAFLVIVSTLLVLPVFLLVFFIAILATIIYVVIAEYREKD